MLTLVATKLNVILEAARTHDHISFLISATVVVPTLNEESRLAACLESVGWAAERIVVDGGSEDGTVQVAMRCGARVITGPFATIGAQRNAGIEAASHSWVLALDADERADAGCEAAVIAAVEAGESVAYLLRRRNFYRGREMRWGGWGSDQVARLFPATERFDDRRVHESLGGKLPRRPAPATISHEPYRSESEWEMKLQRYAEWAAEDMIRRGREGFAVASAVRPPLRVIRKLVLQLGLLDGWRGVDLAIKAGRSVREKYRIAAAISCARRER